jgi:hypothetical protein
MKDRNLITLGTSVSKNSLLRESSFIIFFREVYTLYNGIDRNLKNILGGFTMENMEKVTRINENGEAVMQTGWERTKGFAKRNWKKGVAILCVGVLTIYGIACTVNKKDAALPEPTEPSEEPTETTGISE